MSILRWLGFREEQGPEEEIATIRRIAERLDRLPPERARFVAGFAYLLSRVAHADRDISDEESALMERLVAERGHLPGEQATLAVEMAKSQARLFGGTENYVVTRALAEVADTEQKLWLLDCLFAIASADLSVSVVEENEIRQIASELNLEHRDYIAVRSRYRQRLAVLRREEDEEDEQGDEGAGDEP